MLIRIVCFFILFSTVGLAEEQPTEAVIDKIITVNKAWLQPDWNKRKGLVYDYAQEHGHLEHVAFDQEGNCLVQNEVPAVYPDDRKSVAAAERHAKPFHLFTISKDSYLYGDENSILFFPVSIARQSVLFWGESGRANIAAGWHWQSAITFLGLFPDELDKSFAESSNEDEILLTLKPKNRDATLEMGTMLAYTSYAYLPNRRYERCEVRINKATLRPIEERFFRENEEEAFAKIRYSGWFNIADEQVPGKIEAEQTMSETKSFSTVASFRERNGCWLAEKIDSKFHEEDKPDSGSVGTVTIVTDAEEKERRFQKITEVLKIADGTKVLLDNVATYALDEKVTVPYRLNSPISIEIAGKTENRDWSRNKIDPKPWEYRIGLIECRVKESGGKIIIDTDVVGTNFGTDYHIPLRCRLLNANGRYLAEIEKSVQVKTYSDPTKQTVSFEFDTSSEQFNHVRDFSYQFWSESSGLKNRIKVFDGLQLGNWLVDPQEIVSIQFNFHIGEVSGWQWGSTFLYR